MMGTGDDEHPGNGEDDVFRCGRGPKQLPLCELELPHLIETSDGELDFVCPGRFGIPKCHRAEEAVVHSRSAGEGICLDAGQTSYSGWGTKAMVFAGVFASGDQLLHACRAQCTSSYADFIANCIHIEESGISSAACASMHPICNAYSVAYPGTATALETAPWSNLPHSLFDISLEPNQDSRHSPNGVCFNFFGHTRPNATTKATPSW